MSPEFLKKLEQALKPLSRGLGADGKPLSLVDVAIRVHEKRESYQENRRRKAAAERNMNRVQIC